LLNTVKKVVVTVNPAAAFGSSSHFCLFSAERPFLSLSFLVIK